MKTLENIEIPERELEPMEAKQETSDETWPENTNNLNLQDDEVANITSNTQELTFEPDETDEKRGTPVDPQYQ